MSLTIYEIDQAIMDLVDLETGEILDYEAFSELKIEREAKIEGMALWTKNLDAEVAAIKAEEKALAERRKPLEKKSESLKKYIAELLAGDKFTTARVACTFRKSKAVEIQDEAAFILAMQESMHYEYLTFGKTTVNKTEVTNAIKAGKEVPGAQLIEKNNLSIK